MDFVYGIVTYHRPNRQSMLQYLHGLGYKREDIIVQTQDREDYFALLAQYEDWATILYKRGHNVSENKNNLLDWVCEHRKGKKVVVCSDKVRAIEYMGIDGKLHKVDTRTMLTGIVERAFEKCENEGAELWGTYTTENTFFMSHTMHVNAQLLGCFMGVRQPEKWRFDPEQPLKEDFELVARIISKGGCVLRFNDLALNATFHTQGGCYDLWNAKGDEVNRRCNERLLAMYPELIKKHPTRRNEQKYIGKSEKKDYSIIKDL